MSIAILGGGITGLCLGRIFHERGYGFSIYEKEDRAGGLCRSERVEDFVFDIAGGHILYSKDKEILRLIKKYLGEENLVQTVRNTKIFFKGNFVKYPFENGLSDLSKDDNYECLKGYIEAYFNRMVGRTKKPGNFKDWLLYRFGAGISEKFMFPYNEKLWKIDLSEMGVEWIEGRIPNAPVEDIIKSSIGIETEGYVHQSIFYYPLNGGIQRLADKIAEGIEESILLSTPVTEVVRAGEGWKVNGREHDVLISSIPIPELVRVLKDVPPGVREAAENLDFVSMACFLIGLEGEVPFPFSWVYLPHPENGPCNRITYLSRYSPNNAPMGKSSVLAEVTFRQDLPVDENLVKSVVESLHRNGLVNKDRVVTVGWKKTKYAYVSFSKKSGENRKRVVEYLKGQGIHLLGRFGRFEYLNVDSCLRSALDFAKELA